MTTTNAPDDAGQMDAGLVVAGSCACCARPGRVIGAAGLCRTCVRAVAKVRAETGVSQEEAVTVLGMLILSASLDHLGGPR